MGLMRLRAEPGETVMMWRRLGVALAVICSGAVGASAQSNNEKYELEERCGKRAAQYFSEHYGNEYDRGDKMTTFNSFRNHYNPRLNKCYVLVVERIHLDSWAKEEEVQTLTLMDLNENNKFGTYVGNSKSVKMCEMKDDICHSEIEWWNMTKQYMED
jgi:hypothetical protein